MKTFILFLISTIAIAQIPAFPGAEGFGASATGGRGGSIYFVTNLNCNGVGSLNYGLQQSGKRTILFKVSGVIPCAAEVVQGQVYIAGQSSPGGITVRGIIIDEIYEENTNTDNVIIRHLRSRPKMSTTLPNQGYVLDDGLRLDGANTVIVDHCSFSNAADESVQISHSQNITIQNSMLAETLGEHFDLGGMLLNYSRADHPQNNISIHHNLWNRIGGRFPEFSCESPYCQNRTLNFDLSHNLFWDQQIQTWYNPCTNGGNDCKDFNLNINMVGNRSESKPAYHGPLASFDFIANSNNKVFIQGNTMNLYPNYSDLQLFYCCNDFNTNAPNENAGAAQKLTARHSFPSITNTSSAGLREYMQKNVGAFPRDPQDVRLLNPLKTNTFLPQVINGTDYFNDAFTLGYATPPISPVDTDNDGMPDDWETENGLNPNLADNNGLQLSKRLTGIEGYTNLECYLNQLSDKLVGQKSDITIPPNPGTTITATEIKATDKTSIEVYPNPSNYLVEIKIRRPLEEWNYQILNLQGRVVFTGTPVMQSSYTLHLPNELASGIYLLKITSASEIWTGRLTVLK